MPVAVAEAVAGVGEPVGVDRPRFSVVWHGGEPLVAGREHLAALIAPFGPEVEHHVQTNATLIDDDLVRVPRGAPRCGSSVSVDGPRGAQRRTGFTEAGPPGVRPGSCAGSRTLRRHGFAVLGAERWSAIRPGPGPSRKSCTTTSSVSAATCWGSTWRPRGGRHPRPTPTTRRRCGRSGPSWWPRPDGTRRSTCARWSGRCGIPAAVLDGNADDLLPRQLDPIPTVESRRVGDPCSSPELAGFTDSRYGDFSRAATMLTTPLAEILAGAQRRDVPWVGEFLAGVEACRASCPYFGFCGGGHAANRYFELGRLDGCRRPSTAATARSVYWRECWTMPEITGHRQSERVGGAQPATRSSTGYEDTAAGLADLLQEAEDARRLRSEAAEETRVPARSAPGTISRTYPTFYNWNNRPR